MIPMEGDMVAQYDYPGCRVCIMDAAYRDKTPEELERVYRNANQIACNILINAQKEDKMPV